MAQQNFLTKNLLMLKLHMPFNAIVQSIKKYDINEVHRENTYIIQTIYSIQIYRKTLIQTMEPP